MAQKTNTTDIEDLHLIITKILISESNQLARQAHQKHYTALEIEVAKETILSIASKFSNIFDDQNIMAEVIAHIDKTSIS